MLKLVKQILRAFGFWRGPIPPGSWRDPRAPKPMRLNPRPKGRSGAVAVEEPDE